MSLVLGAIAGVVAFLPFVAALRALRTVTETSNFSYTSIMVLAVAGSCVILFASVAACIAWNREGVLAFAGGEAAGIIVAAIVFGVRQVFFRKRGKGSK